MTMIDKKVLEEYKNTSDFIKEHLYSFQLFERCYRFDANMTDKDILDISNIIAEVWNKDIYHNVSFEDYSDYILESIYFSHITLEELKKKDFNTIMELYNEKIPLTKDIKYDISNLDYKFRCKNGDTYYDNEDIGKFYVINSKGSLNRIYGRNFYLSEEFFTLLNNDEIDDISMSMHFDIRNDIANRFDENQLRENKDGINKYEKYCKENYITTSTILASNKSNGNIHSFEFDNEFSKENKLKKLSKNISNSFTEDIKDYSYAMSLNNGKDYFYNNKDKFYLVIDEKNVIKKMEDTPFFILNELQNKKDNYIYIDDKETEKFLFDLNKHFSLDDYNRDRYETINKLKNYIKINSSYSDSIESIIKETIEISLRKAMNEIYTKELRDKIQSRQNKKKNIDKEL